MIHKIHAAHLVITGSTDSINIQGRLINNGNKAAHTHAAEHVMMLHSCLKHLHKKSVHLVKTQNKEQSVKMTKCLTIITSHSASSCQLVKTLFTECKNGSLLRLPQAKHSVMCMLPRGSGRFAGV